MNAKLLKVKVQAGARENSILERAGDSFLIKVKAPAEGGRANAAVLALLASHLGLPAGKLWIIKGAHSPSKIIRIRP
jgi:uncharacterized protein (TIGR00251 family)